MHPILRQTYELAKRARPGVRDDILGLVAWGVRARAPRRILNEMYRRSSWAQQASWHRLFSRTLDDCSATVEPGTWCVSFAGREVKVPITREQPSLSWDAALSVLGHDVDVKQSYAFLIESVHRPELFIDVGANFGTHSLLFLIHGIETWSYEPNPACHDFLRELCRANGALADIREFALGDAAGVATLWFPEKEAWLGTVDRQVHQALQGRGPLRSHDVKIVTLDDILRDTPPRRTLLKLDTEGSELAVLRGARRVLKERRPLIIFESFGRGERDALAREFDEAGYALTTLPLCAGSDARRVTREEFLRSPAQNFLAVPSELRL